MTIELEPADAGDAATERFCAVVAVRDSHHRDLAPILAMRLAAAGGVPGTVLDVASTDRADALADVTAVLAGRDGVLVVMDAYGGGPASGPLFDETAEHVLRARQPVLVLGPCVPDEVAAAIPIPWDLQLPIDGSRPGDDLLASAGTWWATFGPTRVTVIGLDASDPWPDDGSDPVVDPARAAAVRLRRQGLETDLVRRPSVDPSTALLAATTPAGAVFVVPAPRSPGADGRWFAALRRLVRAAGCPVLAVPG